MKSRLAKLRASMVVFGVACGVAIAASDCGGTVQHTQSFPTNHREVGAKCSPTRPPGITDAGAAADSGPPDAGGPQSECAVDSDCTKSKNGRCNRGRFFGNVCTYDACFDDVDCGNLAACFCDDVKGNHCLAANCLTDSACHGLGCSPSYGTGCGPFGGVQGFYCHTASDTCVDDKDCKGGIGYCALDPKVGYWACSYSICAG